MQTARVVNVVIITHARLSWTCDVGRPG